MNALHKAAAGGLLFLCSAHTWASDTDRGALRRLTPDDLYRVQDVTDPQVSPDGQWVAYVLTTNNRGSDEARSAIWMVSWDGRQRLALTPAAEGTEKPRWSPDGRHLAFEAIPAGTDKAQLMLLDRRGGEARQLTKVSGELGDYAWAPDGKRVVFAMAQSDAGPLPKPIVIGALHFKDDAEGYLSAGLKRHLYLIDVDGARLDALTFDPVFNEDLPTWSPDGGLIAFIRTRELGPDQDGRTDIDVIEARAGASPRSVVRPYAPNTQKLAWSPDGSQIAYLQGDRAEVQRLHAGPAVPWSRRRGGAPRSLSDKLDRAVMSFAFSADSARHRELVEDDGSGVSGAHRSGERRDRARLAPAPFVVSIPDERRAVHRVALLDDRTGRGLCARGRQAAQAHRPQRCLARGTAARRSRGHALQEPGWQRRFTGFVVKPPAYVAGRKYPTLLWIHGGPTARTNIRWPSTPISSSPQMLAAKWLRRAGHQLSRQQRPRRALRKGDLRRLGPQGGRGSARRRRCHRGLRPRGPGASASAAGATAGFSPTTRSRAIIRFKGRSAARAAPINSRCTAAINTSCNTTPSSAPPWRRHRAVAEGVVSVLPCRSHPHADLFMGGDKDFNVPVAGGEQMYEACAPWAGAPPANSSSIPAQHHRRADPLRPRWNCRRDAPAHRPPS
jgi:Tol biopolymer transport system component